MERREAGDSKDALEMDHAQQPPGGRCLRIGRPEFIRRSAKLQEMVPEEETAEDITKSPSLRTGFNDETALGSK